jgi:hypothetical protein
MKLIKILDQVRRDFKGQYQCEFCKNIVTDSGMSSYDDRYFHDNVIPNMKCPNCKKSTISEGGAVDKTPTKYPEGFQV